MSVIQKSQSNAAAVVDQLAAIVPLYNEQATVTPLLSLLIAQEVVSQVVIVDDGSTDNSVPLVKEWIDTLDTATAERIQLVQHDGNKGKGRAIRTGLEHVTCTHVIIQDTDLEYDPADIKKLWDVMQSGEADVVYGSRYLDNPKLQKGRWVMQSGVRFLNLLVRVLYGVKLTDEATCYKMFRTADLRNMNLQCERFEFCPEVTAKAAKRELRIQESQVLYAGRRAGKKLSWGDVFPAIWKLIRLRWHTVGRGGQLTNAAVMKPVSERSSAAIDTGSRWPLMVTTCLLLLIGLGVADRAFGSIRGAVAWLRGVIVYPEQSVIELGFVEPLEGHEVVVPVRNLSGERFTVIGAKTDCGCLVAGGLPVIVEPRSVSSFTVVVTPRPSDAQFERSVSIFVNFDTPPVVVRIRGRVQESLVITAETSG